MSNLEEDYSNVIKDGSLDNPETDLLSAISKARELAAPYSLPEINIYLYSGIHYVLADFSDKYILPLDFKD